MCEADHALFMRYWFAYGGWRSQDDTTARISMTLHQIATDN